MAEHKTKHESRRRCKACGGEVRFDGNHAKSPHFMVTYRKCLNAECGKRWRCEERLAGEIGPNEADTAGEAE